MSAQRKLVDEPRVIPGVYLHYKGGLYIVSGLARHTESSQWLVVYRPHDKDETWVRPLEMFAECVDLEGSVVPRFTRIESADQLDALPTMRPRRAS
jgi:hypothetical protein